jgi:hypothetical protein
MPKLLRFQYISLQVACHRNLSERAHTCNKGIHPPNNSATQNKAYPKRINYSLPVPGFINLSTEWNKSDGVLPKTKRVCCKHHRNHVQPDHGANNLGLQDPIMLDKARVPKRKPNPFTRHTHNAGWVDAWMDGWMDGEYPWVLQTRSSKHDVMASYL